MTRAPFGCIMLGAETPERGNSMSRYGEMDLQTLIKPMREPCACGREHLAGLMFVNIGRDAVRSLPEALQVIGCRKPFIVCDENTRAVALPKVRTALLEANLESVTFTFPAGHVEPDEHAVGALCMAFDPTCDGVLAVGSGVINDCCKVLAHALGKPQAVVATAPSMDGYASNSSSMIRGGVKVSLYNACPGAILADTEILRLAPERMLQAGLGDMLAKYIALCEWRISHLVTGEYYCAEVAGLMRASLRKIVEAAPRLPARDSEAVEAVTEGLILSGIAMAFAEVSRPASGLEHYFSHLWEMAALTGGKTPELHGVQVGVGTLLTLRLYDRLKTRTPDWDKAAAAMRAFDPSAWQADMRRVFGAAAPSLIAEEQNRWRQNDATAQAKRLERMIRHWAEISRIMAEELPETAQVQALMEAAGAPTRPEQIGETPVTVRDALIHSRDIRDKYLTSSLLWDLGLLEEMADALN